MNLLSKSYNIYNINELGLQKCSSSSSSSPFSVDDGEKTYRCASHEMRVFDSPNHRIIALKKINIFEKVDTSLIRFFVCSVVAFRNCFLVPQ